MLGYSAYFQYPKREFCYWRIRFDSLLILSEIIIGPFENKKFCVTFIFFPMVFLSGCHTSSNPPWQSWGSVLLFCCYNILHRWKKTSMKNNPPWHLELPWQPQEQKKKKRKKNLTPEQMSGGRPARKRVRAHMWTPIRVHEPFTWGSHSAWGS